MHNFINKSATENQQESKNTTIRRLKPVVCMNQSTFSKFRRLKQSSSSSSDRNYIVSHFEILKCLENTDVQNEQINDLIKIDLSAYAFGDFVAIDFETSNRYSHICEIGICVVKNFKIVESYDEYIQPPNNLYEQRWIDIHGITPSRTKDSRFFNQVWLEIFDKYLKGQIVVCHNAKSADVHFLHQNLLEYKLDLPIYPFIDTCGIAYLCLGLSKFERRGQYRLNALCERYGIDQKHHHNALDDAVCCAKLFLKEIDEFRLTSYEDIRKLGIRSYGEYPLCKLEAVKKRGLKKVAQISADQCEKSRAVYSEKEKEQEPQIPTTSNVVVLNWNAIHNEIWQINTTKIESVDQTIHKSWLIKPNDCSFYYGPKHSAFFSYRELCRAPALKNIFHEVYAELDNAVVLICRSQKKSVLSFVQSLREANLQLPSSEFFYSFEIFKKCFEAKTADVRELRYMHEHFNVCVPIHDKIDGQYSSLVSAEIFLKLVQALNIETFNMLKSQYNIISNNFNSLN